PFVSLEAVATTIDMLNTSETRPVAIDLLSPSAARMVGEPLNLPTDGWGLAIGMEDNSSSVRWQLSRLTIELGRYDKTIRENDEGAGLWSGLTEFQAAQPGSVSFVASLRPSRVVTLLSHIDHQRWAIQAHAGNGIVHIHALQNLSLEEVCATVDQLRRLCSADGGSVIVARCPTEWKQRLKV